MILNVLVYININFCKISLSVIAFCKYHNILPPKNTYKIPDNVYHSVWCAIKKGDPSAKIKLTNEQFYTRYSPFHIINDHSLEQYSERYNIKEALSESTFVCLSFGRGKIYENLNFGRGGAIWRLKNLKNNFECEIKVADESSFARKRRQMKCPVQIC
jgi:hypothetical protein